MNRTDSESTNQSKQTLSISASLLRLFGKVQRNEVATVLLLAFNIFLLLTAYYILKVIREPLVIIGGGAEIKRYSSAGQLFLLVFIMRLYDVLTARFGRAKLISAINLFFVSNLLIFYILGRLGVPIGVAFFLWVGIFNVMVVAQFWSLVNDIYTPEQGNRLFAIVGIGSSVGAVTGAFVAGRLFVSLGPFRLMLLAAGILTLCLILAYLVHWRESSASELINKQFLAETPIGGESTIRLMVADRYLLLISTLTLLVNWVDSTGDYILDRRLLEEAVNMVRRGASGGLTPQQFIGIFRANFFSWVNLASMFLQLFLVSRLMHWLGVRLTLFFLPLVSLCGYSVIAALPYLMTITITKAAQNSINYSVENTAHQALFLVTSREAKYKAKTAIDTFFYRGGDALSGAAVWVGSRLGFSIVKYVWLNIMLVGVWIAVMVGIARIHKQRYEQIVREHP